jgi:Pyruvate/2-oxoacid:ferredoxin oxidoreductase delta subunit
MGEGNGQVMWVDVARCTGCGLCVAVCPTGAMALVGDKARVDEAACIGCGACADECARGAIQPVLRGELIVAPERPIPVVRQPAPLTQAAGAALVAGGAGLLARAAGALARTVGRWLTRPSARTRRPGLTSTGDRGGSRGGGGRQTRRRRRGGGRWEEG